MRSSDEARLRILAVLNELPRGFATSYADIAKRAGLPGYHRLVAAVLRDLPEGHQIPWHRVMTACRQPAFAPNSSPYKSQQQYLAGEGVLLENGRVPHHQWLPELDNSPPSKRSKSRNTANKGARRAK